MTNIQVTQTNGQRKYGGPPPEWDGQAPGARCEVYISQVPRDVYEDVLIPLFSRIGPLWEFRLMMNFSGQNRGFAYAKYGSPAIAFEAIRLLDGFMIEPGHHLIVRRSTEKRRLHITQLPSNIEQQWLHQVLRAWFDGLQDVSLKTEGVTMKTFADVKFNSHHNASMAKKDLVLAFRKHFQLTVEVQWYSSSVMQNSANHLFPSINPSPCPSTSEQFRHLHPNQFTNPVFRESVVGGPMISPCSLTLKESSVFSSSTPVMRLKEMCEATWLCQPKYELCYSHQEANGFLAFHYKVFVRGFNAAFTGIIALYPGPKASDTEAAAQQAAAQQVLQALGQTV
ncbi:dead end protein 1 isoform X2 [Synchiropus splendidus]|nr:dead end protein 1 isoform X2 [Synchiropus splendidus]